jgi:hypothetical protein
MESRPPHRFLPWFLWQRAPALRTGLLVWICVSCAFVAWQLIAYDIPRFERAAEARDITSAAIIILLLAIPIFRFHSKPASLFIGGLTAWILLTLSYMIAESVFSLLEIRMGVLQIIMLGAVSYGFVAVFDWVLLLCAKARHRHSIQMRHSSANANRWHPQ